MSLYSVSRSTKLSAWLFWELWVFYFPWIEMWAISLFYTADVSEAWCSCLLVIGANGGLNPAMPPIDCIFCYLSTLSTLSANISSLSDLIEFMLLLFPVDETFAFSSVAGGLNTLYPRAWYPWHLPCLGDRRIGVLSLSVFTTLLAVLSFWIKGCC